MNRTSTLLGGCKSLSDTIRVIDLDAFPLPPLTLAAAQTLARERELRLDYVGRDEDGLPLFRLIDEAALQRLRNQ